MESITKELVSQLLGRSLTSVESDNFDLYMEIAQDRLCKLLCLSELPSELPTDFQLLIARMFAVLPSEAAAGNSVVSSKRVEDFQINFDVEATPYVAFLRQNGDLLSKYSACQAEIRTNKRTNGNDCVHCL